MNNFTKRLILLVALTLGLIQGVDAQTRYWCGGATTGTLTDGTKWSATLGGAPIGGTLTVASTGQWYYVDGNDLNGNTSGIGSSPVTISLATASVTPEQFIIQNGSVSVTMTGTTSGNTMAIGGTSAASRTGDDLVVGSGCTLNLSTNANLTLSATSNATKHTANLAGTVNIAASRTLTIAQGGNSVSTPHVISGTVNINNSSSLMTFTGSPVFTNISGTINVTGISAALTFTGASTATRTVLSGAINITGTISTYGSFTHTPTDTLAFRISGILNYNTAASHTIPRFSLTPAGQLILDGSNTKGFGSGVSLVKGKVSLRGAVVTSGTAPTYSTSTSTLEYKGSAAQTIASSEWSLAQVSSPHVVIIDNTSGVTTISGTRYINDRLRIINGAFNLNTGTFDIADSLSIRTNGTLAFGGGSIVVSGHMVNNGIMSCASTSTGGTATFDGVNKNISGSGTMKFIAMDIPTGASINLLNNINLGTNFQSSVTGTLNAGTSLIKEVTATGASIALGTGSLLRTSNLTGVWGVTNASIDPDITVTLTTGATGNTIEFYAPSGTQDIYCGGTSSYYYNNINITGAGTKRIVNGTSLLDCRGYLTIGTGNTLDVSGTLNTLNIHDIDVSGNFINNGIFTARTGNVNLESGSAGQTITMNGSSLYDLELSTTGGMALGSDATVTNSLTFTNGRLILGAYDITLGSGATISNTPSTTKMVVTDGLGEFKKVFVTGTPSFTFPIGEITGTAEYSPVALTFSTNSIQRTIGLRITDAAHPNIATGGTPSDYITRYWSFTNDQAGTMTYTGTADYESGDPVGSTESAMSGYAWNGSSWSAITNTGVSTGLDQLTFTSATNLLSGVDVMARTASPPAGDEPCTAYTITPNAAGSTTCSSPQTADALGATQTNSYATCDFGYTSTVRDVWFKFVATATTHTITVTGSASYDAVLQVYSATSCSTSVVSISGACADNSSTGATETVQVTGLLIGNTYYYRVYHGTSSVPATTTFSTCVFTPNTNNEYCNNTTVTAVTLTPGTSCTTTSGDAVYASQTNSYGSCDFGYTSPLADMWYRFQATNTSHTITVVGNGTFDPIVTAYSASGSTCPVTPSAISGACIDATAAGGTEILPLSSLTVGNWYYVRVYHGNSTVPSNTTFTICVQNPPANDEPCNATTVTPNAAGSTTCSSPTSGNASLASQTYSAASCDFNFTSPSRDVWFKFAATAKSHTITVTGNGTYDPILQVYNLSSGTCPTASFTSISGACNDATGAGATETVQVSGLTIGTIYYYRVYHGNSTIPSNTTFSTCVFTPNTNDEYCNGSTVTAVTLTPGSSCSPVAGNAVYGSQTNSSGSCDGGFTSPLADMWYRFQATTTSLGITVTGNGTYDPIVTAYNAGSTSTCPVTPSSISGACVDNTGAGGTETLSLTGLTINNWYYVRVYHGNSTVPSNTTFTICAVLPPANDECSGAVSLTLGTGLGGTTIGATNSGTSSYCGSATDDVWYSFTAPAGGSVAITLACNTGFDGSFNLRGPATCPAYGSDLVCVDYAGTASTETLRITGLTPTSVYKIRVSKASSFGTSGTFTITVANTYTPTGNDLVANATVASVGNTTGVSSATYGMQLGEPVGNDWYFSGGVADPLTAQWFRFTPSTTGCYSVAATAATPANSFDSEIAIYTTTNVNTFSLYNEIASNEDIGTNTYGYNSLNGVVPVTLNAGTTYYIQVNMYPYSSGTPTLRIVDRSVAAPVAAAATSPSCTGFTANWAAVTNASSYVIDVATDAAFTNIVVTNQAAGSGTNYAVSGLTAGTDFYYRIRAVSVCGVQGVNSNVIAVIALPASAPVATAGSGATTTQITANWNTVSGAASYFLEVSTVSNFASTVFNSNVGNVLTYNVGSLTPATTYYYRVTAVNSCGNSAVSNTITYATLTPVTGPLTWNGSQSQDWNNILNWTPNNIPTALDDVLIPDMPNDPSLTTGANGNVKDVTINSGATVNISAGKTIDVKGNWTGVNNVVSGAGKMIFSGSTGQTITGGATFATLQVNNNGGVTAASGSNVVNITNALELVVGQLSTNGNVTLKSDIARQAYVDDFSGSNSGTISGSIKVERYITTGPNGYRYIGAPVRSGTGILSLSSVTGPSFPVQGTPGQAIPQGSCSFNNNPVNLAPNSPYATFMRWEEPGPFTNYCRQQGWYFQTTGSMTLGRGYGSKLSGGSKVTYTGLANTGTNTYACTHTNVFVNATPSTPAFDGWNLVSNPFPSAIEISSIPGDGDPNNNMPAGFDGQIQFYQTSGPFTGTYLTYNVGTQVAPIALGQGFWVRVTNAGTSNFTLTDAHRVTSDPDYHSVQAVESHLNIVVNGNGFADQTDINFLPEATLGFDFYDAFKWQSANGQPTLFTIIEPDMISINSNPSLTTPIDIPMGLKPGDNGTFTLSFNDLATFPATAMITVEDLFLDSIVNIRTQATYTFSSLETDSTDRFIIHFQPSVTYTVVDQDCDHAGSITFNQAGTTTWATYNVKDNSNNTYAQGVNYNGSITVNNLAPQEYILNVTHSSGHTAQVFVTVNDHGTPITMTLAASDTTVLIDENVTLTATVANSNNLSWNFGDSNTAQGGLTQTHNYDAVGDYTVTLTATNDSCTKAITQVIHVGTVGINNQTAGSLVINGQGEQVVIQFNNWGGNKADIFMYNALGQRVETLTGVSTLKGRQELNIAGIIPGYYFIQVVSGDKVEGKKLYLGNN